MTDFRELSEQHSAHEADQEQRLRAKSLIVSMGSLAGFFVLVTVAAYLVNRRNILDALAFGGISTGYFFVLSLGFKLAAVALVDGYHPFPKAMLLTGAVALSMIPCVALSIYLGAIGSFVGFLLTCVLAIPATVRIYQTTALRAFFISFCGILVGGFFLMLVAGTLLNLLGR